MTFPPIGQSSSEGNVFYRREWKKKFFHRRDLNKTLDANCFIGGMLETTQHAIITLYWMDATTEHANYSAGEMLGFTQDANYFIGGMRKPVSILITLLDRCFDSLRMQITLSKHANYSTGEMFGFTHDANYSFGGML